jgi:hypothetical protein
MSAGAEMIKFKATRGGRETLGLGISGGNVKKLKHGDPILILKEDMDLPFDILIFYGDTEQELVDQFRKRGLITSETIIHDHRERKKQ